MKRMLTRINFRVQVTIKTEKLEFTTGISNLSLNGMLIDSSEQLELSEHLKATIKLTSDNSDQVVNLKGIVIRKEGLTIAIQFMEIELDSFILLRNIIIYNNGDSEKIDDEFNNFIAWEQGKNNNNES